MNSAPSNSPGLRSLRRLRFFSAPLWSWIFSLGLAGLLFAPTSGLAAEGALPGYVVLPLTYMSGANQACISVSINGRSTRLMLDTGSYATVLDQRFYQGVQTRPGGVSDDQLPPEFQHKNVTTNGEKAQVGYITEMTSGAMNFGKGPVVVTDLSNTIGRFNGRHPAETVGGLLGQDILHRYAAVIDWRRRGVYFNTDPSKRINFGHAFVGAGWKAIPMSPTNGRHFTVQCTVENKPVQLMVDTGAEFTSFRTGVMSLPMRYNRDTGGSMVHLASTAMAMSMIGLDATAYLAKLDHWQIGDYPVGSTYVVAHQFPSGFGEEKSAGDGPILGLLGAEVLAKNNAVIDIAGSALYLKPSAP